MTTTKRRAVLTGDTFQVRNVLKSQGWQWDADRKVWTCEDDWTDEAHVIRRVRSYGGIRNRGTFAATIEEV